MARETIIRTVLSNCLQIKLAYVPQRTVNLGLFINYGTKDEDLETSGLAHYVEHVLFNPNYMPEGLRRLYDELIDAGASYEAYTSKEYTRIMVACLPEQVAEAIKMLSQIVTPSAISAEVVEHERSIILHEHAMRFSSGSMLGELMDHAFWGDHSIGLFVVGRRENIMRFSSEDIERRVAEYYTPDAAYLVALGPIADFSGFIDEVEHCFGAWQTRNRVIVEPSAITEPRIIALPTGSKRVDLVIGYLGVPVDSRERPALELLADILGGGLKSRLFQEVRERQKLVYMIHAYTQTYRLGGYLAIKLNCDVSQIPDAYAAIMKVIGQVAAEGVTHEELNRAKAARRTAILRVLENSAQHLQLLGQRSVRGEDFFVDLLIRETQAVRVENVNDLARRIFTPTNQAMVGLGPRDEDLLKLI